MLILKKSVLQVLWISFVGGVAGIGVWAMLIQVSMFLLDELALAEIFDISLSEEEKAEVEKMQHSKTLFEIDDDDNEDLTLSDLYSSDSTNSPYGLSNPDYSIDDPEKISQNHFSDIPISEQDFALDANGRFSMTSNGKTLKATPQEGAQAIKKVLHDDK